MFRWVVLSCLLVFVQGAAVLPKIFPNDRIVGGYQIDISEIPYQVSLQDERHFCGGILISPVYVITAAHCTIEKSSNDIAVRIGSNDDNNGGEFIPVVDIIEHPLFDIETMDYDIAILVLSEPQTWTIKFPVLADATSLIEDGDLATVSGWGVTGNYEESSDLLRAVDVPIVNHNECNELYESSGGITDRQICAGNVELGGIDSCQGDSGGPLTLNGELIGVVSWGIGCGNPGHPGVYTLIPSVRQWIIDTISFWQDI